MFRVFLALFLAFIVTLGRAENFECRSKQEVSDDHGEVMQMLKGLIGKITELESGFKSIQKTVFLIQSSCNQRLTDPAVLEKDVERLPETTMLETDVAQIRKEGCAPNHQLFEGACYFFSSDKEDWSAAQQKCRGMGGNLVKITSDNEFLFIQNQITDDTWIGLSDQDYEGQFKWIADGSIYTTGSSLPRGSRIKRSSGSGGGLYEGSGMLWLGGSGDGSGMKPGTGPYGADYDTYDDSDDYDSDEYGWGEDYYLDEDDDNGDDDGVIWWHSGEPNNDWRGEDCVEFRYVDDLYQLNDVPCDLKQKYVCQTEEIYIDGQ